MGGIGGGAVWLCARAGLPPPVAAVWALAAMIVTTGALHEDGLADTADGFGGGRTRERKLAIMRDSRIGTFGALALLLSLAVRGASVAALASPGAATAALVAAGALGRGAIVLVLLLLAPARTDGMAAGLGTRRVGRGAAGIGLAALIAVALLPTGTALRLCGAALVMALALCWLARRQIGGHTGDVLGAASVATECAVLSLLAAG